MIDDARIGDELAMVNDAQVLSDDPRAKPPSDAPMSVTAADETGQAVTQSAAAMEVATQPTGSVTTSTVNPEPEEAEGRAAAEAKKARSSNPYDGRTSQGKAWYRGYDSVTQ